MVGLGPAMLRIRVESSRFELSLTVQWWVSVRLRSGESAYV